MKNAALVLAVACAIGAVIAASLQAAPAVIGLLAALGCLAVAAAAASAAKALRAPNDLTEDRADHGPSGVDPLPADSISRRGAFGRLWGYAAGAFAVLGFVPFLALARKPSPQGTAWHAGARLVLPDGRLVRADDVAVGGVATVFPEGSVGAPESATLLIRLRDGLLPTQPGRAGWAPRGNVAYSKICTHAGCPVAIYRQASYQLYCPCHQSVFDVLDAARPIAGPATRALPQLALEVDPSGYLVARGDFTEPVGPDSWWRTI